MDRVLSYIVDLRRISSLSFIPLSPSNLRPFLWKEGVSARFPSLGRGCRAQRGGVGFLFFGGKAASSLPSPRGKGVVSRKAVFSYRSLPPLGKGDRAAVDRVLSQTAYLRRSSSLFFTPPSPSNLRPFGAPPSIGRREYPREPLPLEGATERSEAGLAFFFLRRSRHENPEPLHPKPCYNKEKF